MARIEWEPLGIWGPLTLGEKSIARLAAAYGLIAVHSIERGTWRILDGQTAAFLGAITEELIVDAPDPVEFLKGRFAELSGDMGCLYALRREAGFAKPAKPE